MGSDRRSCDTTEQQSKSAHLLCAAGQIMLLPVPQSLQKTTFAAEYSAVNMTQGLPEYQAVARTFKRGVLISEVPRFSLQVSEWTPV